MKKRIIILFALVLVVAVGVLAYIKYESSYDKKIVYENFTIENGHFGRIEKYDASHTVEGYEGATDRAYYINGNLTSTEDRGYTVITFDLYDKNNNKLGTAVASLSEVKKGKKYKIKALSLVESKYTNDIDHYKLKDIQ